MKEIESLTSLYDPPFRYFRIGEGVHNYGNRIEDKFGYVVLELQRDLSQDSEQHCSAESICSVLNAVALAKVTP